jgi:hypothetical protein
MCGTFISSACNISFLLICNCLGTLNGTFVLSVHDVYLPRLVSVDCCYCFLSFDLLFETKLFAISV